MWPYFLFRPTHWQGQKQICCRECKQHMQAVQQVWQFQNGEVWWAPQLGWEAPCVALKPSNMGFLSRCRTCIENSNFKAMPLISLIITIWQWILQTMLFPPTTWLRNTNVLMIRWFKHYKYSVEPIITLKWIIHSHTLQRFDVQI